MSSRRNGFVIYHDDMRVCDILNNEQLGELIRMLWAHSEGREVAHSDDLMGAVFLFMSQKIDRDEDKYQRTVEKRKEAANKRWREQHPNDA